MTAVSRSRTRGRPRTIVVAVSSFVWVLLGACSARSAPAVETIAVAPQAWIKEAGGIVRMGASLHTRDEHYNFPVPSMDGWFTSETSDEILFPTMVLIVGTSDDVAPSVFLARSPHGGCLIEWNKERQRFLDPCYGSVWDRTGQYEEGPALRDMDRLPVEVRDGMLWVTNEITYGQPVAFDNP